MRYLYNKTLKIFICAIFFTPLMISIAHTQQNPITAKVTKPTVETGEMFQYIIVIQGNFAQPFLKLPDFTGLKIVSQQKRKQIKFINRQPITIFQVVITAFAPEPGTITLEPATLQDQQNTYQSESVTITIQGRSLQEKRKVAPYLKDATPL